MKKLGKEDKEETLQQSLIMNLFIGGNGMKISWKKSAMILFSAFY